MDRLWKSFGASFVNMHHSISQLVHTTTSASEVLSAHANAAQSAHTLQIENNQAAAKLVDTISQLREVAHAEMVWINETGGEIRQRILLWERARWGWSWEMFRWVAEVFWRGESSSLVVCPILSQ